MTEKKTGMDTTTRNVSLPPALAMILEKPQKPKEYKSRSSNYKLRLRKNWHITTKVERRRRGR